MAEEKERKKKNYMGWGNQFEVPPKMAPMWRNGNNEVRGGGRGTNNELTNFWHRRGRGQNPGKMPIFPLGDIIKL